jgi:hypothetical protein
MTKRKSINTPLMPPSGRSVARMSPQKSDRNQAVCLEPNKRRKSTKTQPKPRRVTSKPSVTAATSVQFPLAGFDPSMEIAEERCAWSELSRQLAKSAKNFNPEASVRQLKILSVTYDAIKSYGKKKKYELLQRVYNQFVLATISGKLSEVIELYRQEGMRIHSDVHPVLALIRANIPTSRDCVSRWGLTLRYAHTKQIRPEELIGFLKEHGIERCCDEFRKLQAQAQIAVAEDGGARVETSVEEIDAEKGRTTKTDERRQALKSGKKVAGKAGDQNPIETTTDFDVTFRRITRNRKDVPVNIDGYVSADGRLSLQTVRIADGSATRKRRPKTH